MRHNGLTRGFILGVLMLGLVVGVARAAKADDEVENGFSQSSPDVRWGGLYAGGQFGWSWSDFDWTYQNPNYFNTLGATVVGSDFSQDANGVIGGGLVGWNYQTGPWVFGVEGSISAADLKDDRPSTFFPTLDVDTSEIDWLATATGRVGYAWDRWLVFGKAGYAGANVELTLNDATNQVRANTNSWASGWTVGAGTDYMIDDGMSLGLAYDYIDLDIDDETVTCPACGTGVGFGTPTVDSRIQVQSVMARLVFYFGP
jgi:outer membrane immunogenic protein